MNFGQSIDIVVVAFDSKVLCEVDDSHIVRDVMFFQESLALSVSETEEQDIHLVERHLVGEEHVGLSVQSLMYVAHRVSGV